MIIVKSLNEYIDLEKSSIVYRNDLTRLLIEFHTKENTCYAQKKTRI